MTLRVCLWFTIGSNLDAVARTPPNIADLAAGMSSNLRMVGSAMGASGMGASFGGALIAGVGRTPEEPSLSGRTPAMLVLIN